MVIPLCAAFFLALSPDAAPQPGTGRVTGTIVEARTNAPLAAVLIKVQSTGQRVFSDAEGRFEIPDIAAGSQTLLISVVGFGLVRRDVTVVAGETVSVSIPVAEGASTYVEDVAVSASLFRDAEPGVPSQSVLGSRELFGLRGLIADDPYRAAQMLPGVAANDDFRAEFAVRGLGPSQTGISIDGVDSPLLFHTVRGVEDTGSLGLINSDILESATLLSGPHPQRLNSHLGSRLDFTTRDGARARLTVRGLISASAASTVWEGPFGNAKKASWLVAIRQSYLDWLLRMIDTTSGATFGYLDGQAKLTFDLTPRQTLRASVIAGRSALREEEEDVGPNELTDGRNAVAIGNLQWRFTPSARFTVTQQIYALKADFGNRVADGRLRDEGGDLDITWRGGVEWHPTPAHIVEFGAQAQWLNSTRINRRFTATSEAMLVNAHVSTWSAASWMQYRWTPTARLSVAPGVRVEQWDLIEKGAASPWLLTEYEVRSGMRLRFGTGLQRQAPTIDQAMFVLPGTQLVAERAAVIEAGIEQRIGDAWLASGSVYHRRDTDLLRFEDAEIRIENNRVILPQASNWQNALTGEANGVELKLERRSTNGLNGWVSYAWNKYELEDSRGAGQPAERFYGDYDQRHTLNTYIAYRWSGRTSLSARMRYGSNFPIRGYIGSDAIGYVLAAQRNTLRLPAYARLDLRADRTFTYRKSRLTLFMEIVNATNRENFRPSSAGVNVATRRVFEPAETTFPLLPVAGILLEF
jgi:outer membrane receptor for ferrienterochelin and colicin